MGALRPMGAKPGRFGDNADGSGVSGRLRHVRETVFGARGRAAFARALGISPSTYNYYEKGRVPPPDLLARAAEVTGAGLEWLVTGQGAPLPEAAIGASATVLSQPSRKILGRFAKQAGVTPKGVAARTALGRLLAEIQRALPPSHQEWAPHVFAAKPGYVPIVGRTAAGILAAWEDFFAGEEDPHVLERILKLLEGKAGKERTADLCPGDPQHEGETPTGAEAMLVQFSEPTADGAVEFVALPGIEAAPGTFGLRVDGDSMAPRIPDGDIVISRRGERPQAGQTAVVKVRGRIGVTVKLWRPDGNGVHLVPINEAYEPTVCGRDNILWAARVLWVVRL